MSTTAEPGLRSSHRPRAGVTSAPKLPRDVPGAGFISPAGPSTADEDEPQRPAPRRRSAAPAAARCHVLLIEDDVATANALRVLLTMHGCEVAVARLLEQGLDLLRINPTAIVTDLMLPDGDGIEVLARVRDANLPILVIVTTSVGDPMRLAAVHRLKPECVLRKPIDLGELLRAVGIA